METLTCGLLFTFVSMQSLKNDKPMSISENKEKRLGRN